ncbi:MAG: lipopolysaccharide biosynthesis protein [Rhizobiaceae bacterium]
MTGLLFKLTGLTGARLAGSIAAFASTVLIGRQFGTEVLANFAVWMSAAGILSVIMPAGLQSLAPVVLSKADRNGDREIAKSLLGFGRVSIMVVTSIVLAFGLIWGILGNASPSVSQTQIFLSIVLMAPLMALVQLHAGALNGLQKHLSGQLPDTLLKPLTFLCLLSMATFSGGVDSAYSVLVALTLSLLLAVSIQTVALSRALRKIPQDQFTSKKKEGWWKRSFSWLGVSLLWDYHVEILMLVVAAIANPLEVAVLYVCFRIRVLLGFGVKTIYQVLQPAIFAADTRQDMGLVQGFVGKINTLSAVYVIPAFLAISLLGPEILKIFDPAMSEYGAVLLTVCSVLLARATLGPAITILASNDMQNTIAKTLFAGLFVSLIGSLVLYPSMGILGVAVSYTLSSGLAALWMRSKVKRIFGIDTAIWATRIRADANQPDEFSTAG